MRILNVVAAFLCVCLSFALHAQTSVEDSVAVHKLSHEKADSLLIALSKGKYKATSTGNTFHTDTLVPEGLSDTLTSGSLPVDTLISVISFEGTAPEDSTSNPDVIADTSHVTSPLAETASSEMNRKKARVARRDLLVEQDGEHILLKGDDDTRDLRSINEGTVLGVGGYQMRDRYLSRVDYGGVGFRFMNERMRLLKSGDRGSRQNIVNVDVSSALNGAERANLLSAFVDYSLGYHYRFLPDPYFKILVGGSARGMLGMVYNTRNGNNPMTVHGDVDLNFSLLAIYEFHIKKHPLAIRYQFEIPFLGVLFSPVYDQSYYEIFTLGNTAEIFNFNSFHNKFAMRHYLTLDFPVGNMTVRTGYLCSYYSTNVHQIDRHIISHNFMLGFVKEFVVFGGREMKKRHLYRSAYY